MNQKTLKSISIIHNYINGDYVMKLKYFTIAIFILLLVCCANAVCAASDDNNTMELEKNNDVVLIDNELSINYDGPLSVSQDEIILEETENSVLSVDAGSSSASPLKKFTNDLNNGEKNVYLTGDIKVSSPFIIKHDVVIDGQGHSIDGQKKSLIFKVSGHSLTLKNIVIKNAKHDKGGAIFAVNSNLNLQNCVFTDNEATVNGGAIYLSGGKLTIDKSTFKNNVAHLRGGAIITYSAKVTITDSTFDSNKIENSNKNGYGGALWMNGGSSSISNTVFKKNKCVSKALKSHKKATKYQFSGGAIYYSCGSTHTLTGCTFEGNEASNAAGAVYGLKCSSLTISNCIFKKNKASFEDGGAICFTGKKLVMKNSKFNKNHAYEDGGVMDSFSVNKNKVRVTISGCEFKANSAYKGAGVIWLGLKTNYNIKNSKFINNKAGMGGVFYSEDCKAKITKCLFQGNSAKKVASWTVTKKGGGVLKHLGGAIMLQKKSMKISKCVFKKNHATTGGAIFKDGGSLKVTATKFSGNTAKAGNKNVHNR